MVKECKKLWKIPGYELHNEAEQKEEAIVRNENIHYIQAKQDGYAWNARNCMDYMKEK